MVKNLDFPTVFVAKNRWPFFAFYEAMRARRTLGLASGDSHWAGISEMVWHISVGALGAEIFAPKVGDNLVKVLLASQTLEASWSSWKCPGSQGDTQGCSPCQINNKCVKDKMVNQTNIPRVFKPLLQTKVQRPALLSKWWWNTLG